MKIKGWNWNEGEGGKANCAADHWAGLGQMPGGLAGWLVYWNPVVGTGDRWLMRKGCCDERRRGVFWVVGV